MENTDNVNALAGQAIEQEMRSGAIVTLSGAYFETGSAIYRLRRDSLNMLTELADIKFRLFHTPFIFGVIPDVIEV